ncbi:MAG: hypothetical protein LBS01_09500 [Prevotellaceae bacterium]|jgi:hypothetical protein|nr:hypothetical protein [Prevotellaceae bacterium]
MKKSIVNKKIFIECMARKKPHFLKFVKKEEEYRGSTLPLVCSVIFLWLVVLTPMLFKISFRDLVKTFCEFFGK